MSTICQSIATIAANYQHDGGVIEAAGLTKSGDVVTVIIDAYDGDGQDYIWPGFNFLPYGGIYYNWLICSVCDAADKDRLQELADSMKDCLYDSDCDDGDDGDGDWIEGGDSISNFIDA